ncbi:MAG: hypothetical protein RI556_01470 [Hydrogenovibrio sp.]|uniref:hypothetical protein n=1 Tax=Hydrogenovibrio sp. TaxID=2065821 RepID=UPI00286FF5EC|nr:hypothetical protein [Hydrogenovibrio sp.]MDR9497817.1 hypothetical protein [Hydrogenovibrio sp.]
MATKTRSQNRRMRGFGLLQMAVILTLIGGAATLFIPQYEPAPIVKQDRETLKKADELVQKFLVREGRLPCVDTDGDGVEDCSSTAVKGGLPYETLGLEQAGFRAGDSVISYGVYRNEDDDDVSYADIDRTPDAFTLKANDADLAVSKNRYAPTTVDYEGPNTEGDDVRRLHAVKHTNPDASEYQNGLDFCRAVQNADQSSTDSNRLSVVYASGPEQNVAYALAAGGALSDTAGSDNLLDGSNATGATYNVSESRNDDQIIYRSFNELGELLACDELIQSTDTLANSVLMQQEVKNQAEQMAVQARNAAIVSGVSTAVTAYSVALAGWDMANSIQALSVASTLLASATASCAVLVGCAFIPQYAASVAAASVGVGLSGVALAAGVTGGVLELAATVMYADVAARAGASIPDDIEVDGQTVSLAQNPDYSESVSKVDQSIAEIDAEITVVTSDRDSFKTAFELLDGQLQVALSHLKSNIDANAKETGDATALKDSFSEFLNELYLNDSGTEYLSLQTWMSEKNKAEENYEFCKSDKCEEKDPTPDINADNLEETLEGGQNDLNSIEEDDFSDGEVDGSLSGSECNLTSDEKNECWTKVTSETSFVNARADYSYETSNLDTLYNELLNEARNLPVEVQETNSEGDTETVTKTCNEVSSCKSAVVDPIEPIMGDITEYHSSANDDDYTVPDATFLDLVFQKKWQWDQAEAQLTSLKNDRTELVSQKAALECMSDGRVWQSDQCVDADEADNNTAIDYQGPAISVLEKIDGLGAYK